MRVGALLFYLAKPSYFWAMSTTIQAEKLVQQLALLPHPEGGYYRELYRSQGTFSEKGLNGHFEGDRNYCTSIYFLLTSDNFSAFHRIKQDEIWHFYQGSPLFVHEIDSNRKYHRHALGMNLDSGQRPQLVVPAGSWFGSSVQEEGSYSLVGCTVAPGFDFRDFELADRGLLTAEYPEYRKQIEALTR